MDDATGLAQVRYPSYRELGERFGIAHTQVARYAKAHNCLERRERIRQRAQVMADEQFATTLAERMTVGQDQLRGIVDGYLLQFGKAVAEGRVRCDNPADFDRLTRLKLKLDEGADGRGDLDRSMTVRDFMKWHEAEQPAREIDPAKAGWDGASPPKKKSKLN